MVVIELAEPIIKHAAPQVKNDFLSINPSAHPIARITKAIEAIIGETDSNQSLNVVSLACGLVNPPASPA